MILGIDAGLSGALVLIDGLKVVAFYDMPTRPKSTKNKREVCASSLASILMECQELSKNNLKVYLERVNAMPSKGVRMGAASAFNFGEGFGVIRACLECLQIPYELVSPAVWKRAGGMIGKDKEYSRTIASQLFPSLDLGAKNKGRADAVCIAHFAPY